MIVQNRNNLPGQVVVPDPCDRMVENITQLLQMAPSLGSTGKRPRLLACAVYKSGLGWQACVVGLSLCLGDGTRIKCGGSIAGHRVVARESREDRVDRVDKVDTVLVGEVVSLSAEY